MNPLDITEETKELRMKILNEYCESIKDRLEQFHKQNGSHTKPPIIWDESTKTYIWINRKRRRNL